jgi:hypothetical protein
MARYTNESIVPAALRGETAETANGNFSTVRVDAPYMSRWTGNMPKAWARLYNERVHAGMVSQAVYSYSTPIAWLDSEHGWIIPDVSYSVTTSVKHQSKLYRLKGRTVSAPWDATAEDMRRVLSGEIVFTSKGYGSNRVFTGTVPGPNYVGE